MTEKFKYAKIVSFTAVVMALIILLSAVITPNGTSAGVSKYEKSKLWAMDEKENSIDAFFLGDSEVYSSVSPMELWDKYGYATYSCSHGAIKSYECYDLLESMLSKQNPKIVFIEVNFLYRNYDNADMIYHKISEKLPLFKYHDVWKSYINPNQEYENLDNYSYKGYLLNKKTQAAKKKTYMVETDSVQDIKKNNLDYFDKMYNLCKEKNIEVVLFSAPSKKNWNYKKHNGIVKLADKYKLEYLDLNLVELDINWSKDTRDKGDHVNHKGAIKVTEYLGSYLSEKGILEDHRDDVSYDDWNELLTKYREKEKEKSKSKK